jgi:hypothetical protein
VLAKLADGLLLMALCVVIHAMGLIAALRWTRRRRLPDPPSFGQSTRLLVAVAAWCVLLHLVQVFVWALFYVGCQALVDLHSALYFSAVTYTTTGYGDIVLPKEWRLVGGIEALTGILMCGLSTGLFFAIFSRTFGVEGGAGPPR